MVNEDTLLRLLISKRSTIVAYARSIVMDGDLAEDVYQDVVIVALRKREQVDDSRDLLPWILGVTRLESLEAARKRRGRPSLLDDHILELLDATWAESVRATSDFDMRDALDKCLAKLTDRARRILQLRYTEGLSGEALATQLDAKLNTAYVALSRVHKQLRVCISSRRSNTT